ncbi:MAG: SpoIIE family protein phosphatase [Cytophagales bacterium]|nr:SpoIIE family protein phosphatase [Bernardetiaceae bacterium]MDW8210466.1 SpoIIE family protein phosphatase [Cytophagales bacterium]
MKPTFRFFYFTLCCLFAFSGKKPLLQAQSNKSKVFSGQVVNAQNSPIKGVKVFFEDFPSITAETDANGQFELRMPPSFNISEQTAIYVGARKIPRHSYALNQANNMLVIKVKEEAPAGAVYTIELFDQDNQPLPPETIVTIGNKRYKTNQRGQILLPEKEYLKVVELEEGQINIEGYELSSTYYAANQQRFFVYVKAQAKPAKEPSASPAPSTLLQKPTVEPVAKTEANVNPLTDVVKQDLNKVLNELEMEKQFLMERSTLIRNEIEKIAQRLSNETLSEQEKNELRKYLSRLEKQLIENDLAYESAQEKIRNVVDRMRQEIIAKDSVTAAVAQKMETIAAEKEAAIKQKEAIEALYRARLTIFIIIATILALAAFASYRISQKLKKQKEEIISQRNSIEEKNRNLEKAYLEIKNQKAEIERQNHQITTSIRYAESIQNAILPPESAFQSVFSDHFIFYQPKDIVSGDFYWLYSENGKTLLAVVDCTGHGVPGAFMSMIGYSLLNEHVKHEGLWQPAHILEELDKNLRIALRQEQKVNNDSMDVALCLIEGNQVCFAGAKRALLIYRKATGTLEEIRGDRKPVGGFKKDPTHRYSEHIFSVSAGDALYLFTDGITDQPNPKLDKFGYQQLKEIVMRFGSSPMAEQRYQLVTALTRHSNGTPTRDDMTMIAVRL